MIIFVLQYAFIVIQTKSFSIYENSDKAMTYGAFKHFCKIQVTIMTPLKCNYL